MMARHMAIVVLASMALAASTAAADEVGVTVDPAVRHQTILGWSVNPWGPWMSDWQREQILALAVDELGLNRFRGQEPNGNSPERTRWEQTNDNGDPYEINWTACATDQVDRYVARWVKPFKDRVEARGEKFDLWISPSWFDGGSTGSVPAWLANSPAEFAEHAISYLTYLKNKHGIEADWYVICNEPGNNNAFSPQVVARMIRELGPRFKAAGLRTKIEFPDGVNAGSAWRYIQFIDDDPTVWPYIGMLSYHHYGATDPFRGQMRELAERRGIPNAQTEHMGAKFPRLYDDMTLGGVSYWSIYGWGGALDIAHDGVTVARGPEFWRMRQVMHYVRPGAVRVKAESADASLRVLAFQATGGTTVVLLNDGGDAKRQAAAVGGLAAGRYGVCLTVGRGPYQERGVQAVGSDGLLRVDVPRGAVMTIYPHAGSNQPPTPTDHSAQPGFLTMPAARVTLSAAAADPEGDPIAYRWAVLSAPTGANVSLASPDAAKTEATGLSAAGQYAFRVTIADPAHTVRREVRVNVFATNQPPEIGDLHNRIPVIVTLPETSTLLRAWPHDLEGDRMQCHWSVARQPAGASVALEVPPKAKPDDVARRATGMTVAGEYVFRFHASDGHGETTRDLNVTVYPINHPPKIAEAAARLTGDGKAALSAKAADPDGDTITYWWDCQSHPAGAKASIPRAGAADAEAAGLTVPGKYVFRLSVIDRTMAATRDATVTVR